MEKEKLVSIRIPEARLTSLWSAIGTIVGEGINIEVVDAPLVENKKTVNNHDRELFSEDMVTFLRNKNGEDVAVITSGDLKRFEPVDIDSATTGRAINLYKTNFLKSGLTDGICYEVQSNADAPQTKPVKVGVFARDFDQFIALINGPLQNVKGVGDKSIDFFTQFAKKLTETEAGGAS